MEGKIEFPSPFWNNVSPEATSFVSSLLKVQPNDRLTAEQALQHTWIINGGQVKSKTLALDSAVTILHLSKDYSKSKHRRCYSQDSVQEVDMGEFDDIDDPPRLINVAATPTSLLVKKLKVLPSLQELIAEKVIKKDFVQLLVKESKKKMTE